MDIKIFREGISVSFLRFVKRIHFPIDSTIRDCYNLRAWY